MMWTTNWSWKRGVGLLACCLCLGVGTMLVAEPPPQYTAIIAHRGSSATAPENTLAAVKLGWDQQADGVEIDIHLIGDGRIVVIHDNSTKRTAGEPDLVVAQTPLAELRKLDVGRWKGAQFAGERIPLLEEVLETIPAGKRLFIEIKTEAEILPELERVLKAANRPVSETTLIGFSYDAMRQAKARMPELTMYWLVSLKQDKETGKWNYTPEELIAKAQAAKMDGLNLNHSAFLTREVVQQVREAGLGIYVWTVNEVANARDYETIGLQGITTDKPDVLIRALRIRK